MRTVHVWAMLLATASLAALQGCGGGGDGGNGGGGGDGKTVASLSLSAAPENPALAATCAQVGDECLCPKGAVALLTLSAKDAGGKAVAVDSAVIEWNSEDATSTLSDNGDDASIAGESDWFDGGAEGVVTVTARYAGLTASMPVRTVINAAGNWHASADAGFETDVSLSQSGRSLKDTVTSYTGSVNNDRLTLNISLLTVDARFTSRDEVSGTFSGPNGLTGKATCTRQ